MNLLLGTKEYMLIGLSVIILLMFAAKEYQINALENELVVRDLDIEKYKTTIAHIEASVSVCKSTLAHQSEAIELQSVDIKTKEDALKKLKAQSADVRYKVIYKDVPKITIKSNECDDIKDILDSIKASGL